jgi:hypothetical protein
LDVHTHCGQVGAVTICGTGRLPEDARRDQQRLAVREQQYQQAFEQWQQEEERRQAEETRLQQQWAQQWAQEQANRIRSQQTGPAGQRQQPIEQARQQQLGTGGQLQQPRAQEQAQQRQQAAMQEEQRRRQLEDIEKKKREQLPASDHSMWGDVGRTALAGVRQAVMEDLGGARIGMWAEPASIAVSFYEVNAEIFNANQALNSAQTSAERQTAKNQMVEAALGFGFGTMATAATLAVGAAFVLPPLAVIGIGIGAAVGAAALAHGLASVISPPGS